MKVVRNIPLFLEKHVERLTANKKSVGISTMLGTVELSIQKLLAANNITDAAIRISLVEDGTVLLHATTLPQIGDRVRAVTYETSNMLPSIKQIDRTAYMEAEEYAQLQGAEHALFVKNNVLLESTISNVISLNKHNRLSTPPLVEQGLSGIMRQILLEKGVLVAEEIFQTKDQPIVLVNSLRVQAVTHLNGVQLPNPSTLLQIVQKYIEEEEKGYEDSYHR